VHRAVAVSGTTSSAAVTGLADGTVYRVTVTGSNAVGVSPAGAASGTPRPAYVPSAPAAFTTVPDGSGTVAVSWQPPVDDGGCAAAGYQITYQQVVPGSGGAWVPAPGSSPHRITAAAAARSVSATVFETARAFYLFSITAANTVGVGHSGDRSGTGGTGDGHHRAAGRAERGEVSALTGQSTSSLSWPSPPPAQVAAITVGQVLVAAPGGFATAGHAAQGHWYQ